MSYREQDRKVLIRSRGRDGFAIEFIAIRTPGMIESRSRFARVVDRFGIYDEGLFGLSMEEFDLQRLMIEGKGYIAVVIESSSHLTTNERVSGAGSDNMVDMF